MTQDDPPTDDAPDTTYNRRRFLTGTGSIAAGGLIGSSGLASATPSREPGPKKDELIIGISPSVSDVAREARKAVPGTADVTHTNETIHYATVSFPSQASDRAREQFIDAITRSEHVEYAEQNATIESFGEPNDPYYDSQHAPQQVDCDTAWETTHGSEDVLISVIDQGIQYDHSDLEGVVDDGDDFAGGGNNYYPRSSSESHGTHVGGIAAGKTDNGTGTAGISNCSLLAARALDSSGQGSLSDIADAIQWSADAGADIINLSLGTASNYRTLAAACEYAADQGSLLVGAAGNNGSDAVAYPAAYEDVVAVSALQDETTLASFSNTGSAIDLAAPGTRLVSTVPWDGYGRMSGTSVSAPVVAGVAGLALSAHPGLSPTELRTHLQETAVDIGLDETQQGHGRVDAGAAVETDPFPDEGNEGDEDDESDETDGNDDENEENGDEPGECGDETVSARASGDLTGGWIGKSDEYEYSLRTDDPCSATITLEGPSNANFDLYVTTSGRSPNRWIHDESSEGSGASEEVSLELSGDEELGVLVYADSGSGEYELRIDERGR